ncbi:MAG: transposase [Clostridia bacterium]
MTVPAKKFIRCFLIHNLPNGFMKIQHFGLLSISGKQFKLQKCKLLARTL